MKDHRIDFHKNMGLHGFLLLQYGQGNKWSISLFFLNTLALEKISISITYLLAYLENHMYAVERLNKLRNG